MSTRREFLATTGTVMAVGAGAGALARPARGAEAVDLSEWFAETDGTDEVVDATGQSEVTVEVGATGNGGQFAFDPPVVRVDPGARLVWRWTGAGGSHDVVAEDGTFDSGTENAEGETFAWTAEPAGVVTYACTPHRTLGMRGAIVVGDTAVDLGGGSATGGGSGSTGGEATEATDTSSGDDAASDPGPARSFDGWLDDTSNYEGVLDATGQSAVTVEVGAAGNGGQFAFDPPTVHVDPGTTVIWEWVGSTGPYDVLDPDLGYRSEQVSGPGHTFAVEFGGDGLSTYECSEYGEQGMRGVVLVGDGPQGVLSPAGLGTLGMAGAAVVGTLGYGLKLNEETATNGRK